MDKLDRLTAIQRLFRERRTLTIGEIAAELDCSVPTAKRALRDARARLGMPITWCPHEHNYAVSSGAGAGTDVPGLWLTGHELGGLVTLQTCFAQLAPGPIGPLLAPFERRLRAIVARSGVPFDEVQRRVRVVPHPLRELRPDWAVLTEALLGRRRLEFVYDGRSRPGPVRRVVSPQRLVLYRGNWYMDGWCHLRQALRSFAVERIGGPRALRDRARDVPEADLDAALASSYGIFAGAPTDLARLRFSAFAARWVVDERWHPRQSTAVAADGTVEVTFPVGRREELVQDVLRWAADVEVLAPLDLRREVAERLAAALRVYRGVGTVGTKDQADAGADHDLIR